MTIPNCLSTVDFLLACKKLIASPYFLFLVWFKPESPRNFTSIFMTPYLRLLPAVFLLLFSCLVEANEPTPVDRFYVADGLEAKVWAEAPMLYNPANMDVDEQGRIWVSEAVNYRSFRNEENVNRWHRQGDRIMVLEDTNGDGTADSSHVFVQDSDLVAPMGISVLDNRIFVTCSPNVIVYTDVDRDAKFDEAVDDKEILLTGFGGFDHDHSLHTVKAGADGDLYFTTGNAGPHIVTDKSGWTLRSGSSYRGGSPSNMSNVPGLISDDGRVYVGGLALRMSDDGTKMRVIGQNFRNPYELTLDSFGNVFQNDNDDTISCRVTWVMEYGSLGFSSADGKRTWRAGQRPGQATPVAHWRQEDPGIIPAGDIYGPGSPTGVEYFENGSLGPEYENMLLACEAGRNTIWFYHPKSKGAGFDLRRSELFSTTHPGKPPESMDSADTRKWFRPSDVIVGADGAIYIADFYDAFVGGHRMLELDGHGTIYRITRKGDNPQTPSLDLETVTGQIRALKSPANSVRYTAFKRLTANPTREGLNALVDLSQSENPRMAARAIYALAQMGSPALPASSISKKAWSQVNQALKHENPDLRIVAYRATRKHDPEGIVGRANVLADDSSEAVRREVALSLREIPISESRSIILKLADGFDAHDRGYLEALGYASEGEEASIWSLLSEKASENPLEWSDAFAALTWRLHPVASVEGMLQRALASQLDPAKRKQALDALAFIFHPSAGEAMLRAASQGPEDLRSYAAWWINSRSTNHWASYGLAEQLPVDPAALALAEETKRMNSGRNKLKGATELTAELKQLAIDMALSPAGGPILLHLAGRNELPQMFYPVVAEHIHNNSDTSVRALASRFFPKADATGQTLPPIGDIANLVGDPVKGKELFFGRAVCSTCHLFGEEGRDIGPNMTTIGQRYDRLAILDAVINPSAGIAFGYETVLIETTDGQSLSGFVVGDSDTVIIKDIGGQQHMVSKSKIKTRQTMDQSIMPAGTGLGLNAQDLADVVAFLTEVQ